MNHRCKCKTKTTKLLEKKYRRISVTLVQAKPSWTVPKRYQP